MSRAKRKRLNAMRRKRLRDYRELARLCMPTPAEMDLNRLIYQSVRSLTDGEPAPAPMEVGIAALFVALEASGMRRVVCKCGREWLTRGTDDKCPPCREYEKTANERLILKPTYPTAVFRALSWHWFTKRVKIVDPRTCTWPRLKGAGGLN